MPYQEESQPIKSIAEIRSECEEERLALVDVNEWINACRLMALREYSNNLRTLNYGGTVCTDDHRPDTGTDGPGANHGPSKNKEEEGRKDDCKHHDGTQALE